MRPSNALRTSTLPVSKIKYQWDLEVIRSRGAADAGSEQLLVLVSETDSEAFLREAVGFTTFNKLPTLQRVLPLRHPKRPLLWCDEWELVDYGAYETRTDFGDPLNDNAPAQDWHRYLLTFRRPKFAVFSDAQLADAALFGIETNFEQYRFTESSDLPQPEMRIISGFGVEYLKPNGDPTKDTDWVIVPDERQAIPSYKIQLAVTWKQIPLAAIPYQTIIDCANTVNKNAIRLTTLGRVWAPGQLGFKGLAKPIEKYTGADGSFYVDLAYTWTLRPGSGWNFFPARDAAGRVVYQPMRERASRLPVFRETDHRQLFVPG